MKSQEEHITETDLARCIFLFENVNGLSLDDIHQYTQNKEQFKSYFDDQTNNLQNATSDLDKTITNIQQRRVKVLNNMVKSHFSLILATAHERENNNLDYLQPLADYGMAALRFGFLANVYNLTKKLSHDTLGDGNVSLNKVVDVQKAVKPFEPYQQSFFDELEECFLQSPNDLTYKIQDFFINEMDISDIVDVDHEFDEVLDMVKKIKQKVDELNARYDNLSRGQQFILINQLTEVKYRLLKTEQAFYDIPKNGVLNGIIPNKDTE